MQLPGPVVLPAASSTCSQCPNSPPLSPEWDGMRSLLSFVWDSSWALTLLLFPTLHFRGRERAGNTERKRKTHTKESCRLRPRQTHVGHKETGREGTTERDREGVGEGERETERERDTGRRRQGRGSRGRGGKRKLEEADLLRSERPRSCSGEPASLAARLWPQCRAQHGAVAAGLGNWLSLLSPGRDTPCA